MVMKLFSMFSGYGGAEFALKKANIEFECIGYSEIDKYAIQCYEQNHIGVKNYGDCTKINPEDLPDFDLLTGGFPCQSFSVAGKGLGEQDTRGTLFHDIIRIAEVKKPKYMLLENVKGLTFKNHRKTFDKILSELSRIGYAVEWKVLNSKEYGIPQNRERVFFVCFRTREAGMFDKITHKFVDFMFPEKEELKLFLKDILEDEVDEKYYLKESQIKTINRNFGSKGKIIDFTKDKSVIEKITYPSRINQLETDVSPTLTSSMGTGGGNVACIITHSLYPRSGNPKQGGTGHLSKQDNTSYCLDTGNCQAVESLGTIRKLTPKECFRLMGFLNDEINLEGLSNTQRYKLAGNGWDINLVSKIFKEMFK